MSDEKDTKTEAPEVPKEEKKGMSDEERSNKISECGDLFYAQAIKIIGIPEGCHGVEINIDDELLSCVAGSCFDTAMRLLAEAGWGVAGLNCLWAAALADNEDKINKVRAIRVMGEMMGGLTGKK